MVRYRLHTLECDESSSKPMYSFVFTLASVSWMLLSFLSLILMIFTINNARWIISNKPYNVTDSVEPVFQTLGINTRCIVDEKALKCGTFAVDGLSTDPDVFPTLWKISYIFFNAGVYVILFTTIASFASCHFHTVFNKSIFNIVGCVQALAGLFFVNAFIFYMGGWGSKKVSSFCYSSAPFTLGECTLGTTFYYAVLGVVVTFVSACFSSVADRSTFRYKVTRRVNAGRRLVFVL